jgi:hypothetical protein
MTTTVPAAVNTFLLNHGQVKQLTSIFAPSPNTADVTQCTNSCTIALYPHRFHTVHTQLHHCTISPQMSHSAHTTAPLHHFPTDVTQYTHSCTIAPFPHRCHTVHTQLHHYTISPYNKILLTITHKQLHHCTISPYNKMLLTITHKQLHHCTVSPQMSHSTHTAAPFPHRCHTVHTQLHHCNTSTKMSHSAHTAAPLHHFPKDVTQCTHNCTIALLPQR